MQDTNRINMTIHITTLSFISLGLICFYFFVSNFTSLASELMSSSAEISFNKGSIYLLGISIVLFVFVGGIIFTSYLNKQLKATTNKKLTNVIVALLVATFLMPQLAHYAIDHYALGNGYEICESKSKQWLHVKTIVYSKTGACDNY